MLVKKAWKISKLLTYKKKFNVEVQIYAPYMYAAVMVMVEAMKAANAAEPAVVSQFEM